MHQRRRATCPAALTAVSLLCTVAVHASVQAQQAPTPRRAAVSPSLVHVEAGQEVQFRAVLAAPMNDIASLAKQVKWSVNGIAGGNADVGTIDTSGLYHAPRKAPTPREIHVCGEAEGAANRFAWATVIFGQAPPTYRSVRYWGIPVNGASSAPAKEFHGICLGADGNLLIADQTSSKVLRYSTDGKLLGEIGLGEGAEPGHFMHTRAVLVDEKGRIFVSDTKPAGPHMQVFDPSGALLFAFGPEGTGPGCLNRAHGMGFDAQRRLFVTDVDNLRVSVFTDSGEFLYAWGTPGVLPGEFNAPHGLTVDPSGDLFVTGYYGPTQKFTGEGKFLKDFAHGNPPDDPVRFHSNTGDQWGNVYLLARYLREDEAGMAHRGVNKPYSIVKYNNNGDFVTRWSHSKPQYRESWAVVDTGGTVYSLCIQENREVGVEVFVEE